MYHFVYETRNTLNGMFYIGKHSTEIEKDGYLGSGLHLQRAIKKHGSSIFERKILKYFSSEKEALEYEKELVTENFCARKDTYNIAIGGEGPLLGKVTVLTKDGTSKSISKKEFDSSAELVGITKGRVVVKNEKGEVFQTIKNDPKITSGELSYVGNCIGHNADKMCINDGSHNMYISKNESIPVGWKRGEYCGSSHKDKIRITDGSIDKFIFPNEIIPVGWSKGSKDKGRKSKVKDFTTITNGKEDKYVPKAHTIPEGWWVGRKTKGNMTSPTKGKKRVTDNGKTFKFISSEDSLPDGFVYWKDRAQLLSKETA